MIGAGNKSDHAVKQYHDLVPFQLRLRRFNSRFITGSLAATGFRVLTVSHVHFKIQNVHRQFGGKVYIVRIYTIE